MKKNNLSLLTLSAVVLSSLTSVFNCQPSYAEVPQEFIESLKQNEVSINQCLNFVSSQYLGDNPPARQNRTIGTDFALIITKEKINDTHDCFDSILQSISNEATVKFAFMNTLSPDEASVNGTFEVSLANLTDNALITKEKIKSFSVYNNWCTTENVTEFSFNSPVARTVNELRYISKMLSVLVETESNSQGIISMNNSLKSLLAKDYLVDSFELLKGRQGFTQSPANSSDALAFLQSSETPTFKVKCVKGKNHEFSLDTNKNEVIIAEPKQSQNSGGGWTQNSDGGWSLSLGGGRHSSTTTYPWTGLTIDIRQNNQRTLTTYTGVNISISSYITP